MKELHKFLRVFIFVQLGSCVGRAGRRYIDYMRYPDIYEMQSAPWYSGLMFTLILTAIMVTITTIAYFVVGNIIKKREQGKSEISD